MYIEAEKTPDETIEGGVNDEEENVGNVEIRGDGVEKSWCYLGGCY